MYMLHSIYSKVCLTQKKTGINLGCTLISAVCHIKNNTPLGLYQHYSDSKIIRTVSKALSIKTKQFFQ